MLKLILKFLRPDFASRQGKIISSFVKASKDAQKLDAQIAEDLQEKQSQIIKIEKEMSVVNGSKAKNLKFIANISKFIGYEENNVVDSPAGDDTNG